MALTLVSARRMAALWEDADAARRTFRWLALLLCGATALSFFLLPLPLYQWFSDYWEHASAIRVLAESTLAPSNPHYASADPDRQFIPLFVVLGWLVRYLGIGIDAALAIGAFLTTVLFCLGLRALSLRLFADPWAPAVALLTMLFAWGNPWVWTGFYELRAVFYNNFYPASFVLSLTLIAWAHVLACLQRGRLRWLDVAGLAGMSLLMFTTHQLCGLFAFGGAVLFVLCSREARFKLRALIVLAMTAGILLSAFWPYFNPIALTIHGSGDKSNEGHPDFYRLIPVLAMLGPALLGWPVLLELARKRLHLALVGGAVAMALAYGLGGIIHHPVTHRLLTFMTVYLHLALTWKLLGLWRGLTERGPMAPAANGKLAALLAAGLALAALQTVLALADIGRIGLRAKADVAVGQFPVQDVAGELGKLLPYLPADAIAFATDGPALALTAYKGKVVARPRPQLMIADGAARTIDNDRFFSPATGLEERRALIRKYRASHIVIKPNELPATTVEALKQLGTIVPTGGQLILIALTS